MNKAMEQLLWFLGTGGVTTLIDLALFNLFTGRRLLLGRIQANCLSTTAAMIFSFVANGMLVFNPVTGTLLTRALKFMFVTGFSSYGLQNMVIYSLSQVWLKPVELTTKAAAFFPLSQNMTTDWIQKNTVKGMAILVGVAWNYLWYKFFVYI